MPKGYRIEVSTWWPRAAAAMILSGSASRRRALAAGYDRRRSVDGGLEIDDALENPALVAALGEDGEEVLDGIEPAGRGGREMEHPAGVARPSHSITLGCLWVA